MDNYSISDIRQMLNPFKEGWEHVYDTNCYTYALGLDLALTALKMRDFNNPGGFIKKDLYLPFTLDDLIANLEGDLAALEIEYKEVYPDHIISDDEWMISLMAIRARSRDFSQIYSDFHFLRQTENGIWSHKKGYRFGPTTLDSLHRKIEDPLKSVVETDGFYSSERYEYIKTYSLRKIR